jgi:hypothetical protein
LKFELHKHKGNNGGPGQFEMKNVSV